MEPNYNNLVPSAVVASSMCLMKAVQSYNSNAQPLLPNEAHIAMLEGPLLHVTKLEVTRSSQENRTVGWDGIDLW